jgi:hypothetical protein
MATKKTAFQETEKKEKGKGKVIFLFFACLPKAQ